MIITINGSCMEGRRTGVGRYMANILSIWVKRFPGHKYNVLFRREIPADAFLSSSNVEPVLVPCPKSLNISVVWENVYLPSAVARLGGQDLFFSPSYTLPLRKVGGANVVTIFDISYISHPDWYPLKERIMYRMITGATVRKADIILTGSKSSKKEILRFYDTDKSKIHVTYLSVDPVFGQVDGLEGLDISAKHGLKGTVVLYVGLIANRRNVPTLIEAFSLSSGSKGSDATLVIVGKNLSFPYIDIMETAEKFSVAGKVRWLQYIDDKELLALYDRADLFIYPSLYEGFGIPPLEAMYVGTPVITSNMSSLPEVVGDAAILLNDPTDPVEMAEAIDRVVGSKELSLEMVSKGKERAASFSWQRCAVETMNLFEGIGK